MNKITLRSIIISLIIMPFHIYLIFESELVLYHSQITCFPLFYTSVFILLMLCLGNLLLKKLCPSKALTRAELITIYAASNISVVWVSHDFMQVLINGMCYGMRYATAENNWFNLIINRTPDWAIIKDKAAVDAFYLGNENFFQWKYVSAWLKPMACWSGFVLIMFYVMMCMNTIIRRQWIENEKLSYPLTAIPVSMTENTEGFFRNRLLYVGIFLSIAFSLLQGLSSVFPSFPVMSFRDMNVSTYIVNPPWNAIGNMPIRVYPIVIGILYLIPTDLCFSLFFFYLLFKAECVFGAIAGINSIPYYPFLKEQSSGAIIGIFVFTIYFSRYHLLNVVKTVFSGRDIPRDPDEVMSYRVAFWGMIIGITCMIMFTRALGANLFFATLLIWGYFIVCLSVNRVRAESGTPNHDIDSSGIVAMLRVNAGSTNMGPGNIIASELSSWYNRSFRSNMMPIQMETMFMTRTAGIGQKSAALFIGFITLMGLFIGVSLMLWLYYKLGAANRISHVANIFGSEIYNQINSQLKNGTLLSSNGVIAIFCGFVIYSLLAIARVKFIGFPLHPVAYAMSGSWCITYIWLSAIIAWITKTVILRYGGMRVFLRAMPLFLGLILGDCISGTVWCIIAAILGTPTHSIFP
ncbi:MAG: hypothetical protein ILO36_02895 [Abditibacteriota bacterium]|nr:hypothetical protein [Abditibacteriota bacterium]